MSAVGGATSSRPGIGSVASELQPCLLGLGRGAFIGGRRRDIVGQLASAFPQQPLDTFDRVALRIEQIRDPPQQDDIVGPVVAPAAAALQRLHLGKLGLPEAQHVLRNMKIVSYLTDSAESIGRLLQARSRAGSCSYSRSSLTPMSMPRHLS